jgi:predicted Zn-dependent peptidase
MPHPVGEVNLPGGGEQSRLYVGRLIRLADEAHRAPLMVLNGLLSDRIAFQLREREGLAYAIGSSLGFHGDWGRLSAVMGTQRENLARAREGISQEMVRLRTDLVEAAELEKTVYGLLGANLRRRSAGISRAYAYGIAELHGRAPGAEAELMEALRSVTPEQVRQVARAYLDPEAMLSLAME